MSNKWIINPFTQIHYSENSETEFFLLAPKPQSSFQRLKISKVEQPNLHEVFTDLAEIGFNYFDVESDVNEQEIELLSTHGILIEAGTICELPLFACFLSDADAKEFDGDAKSLIVNPTFHFEPFNIANLAWINEKRLSPHQPSVWIKQPLTEIETGFWLDKTEAETVSKFTAGEKNNFELERDLLDKLTACGILTTPEILEKAEREQSEKIEKAKINYQKERYAVVRELLPAAQMKAMQRFYREYVAGGFMPFEDSQSERFYEHNEPLARNLHNQLTRIMSLIVGEEVIASYVYAASYVEKAKLEPHTDRSQCEFSVSFQVDYLPEPQDGVSPWGLFITSPDEPKKGAFNYYNKEFPSKNQAEDKNTAIYMANGDGLIYKGCELIHYRYALPAGHRSTSLFFHFVPKHFEGVLN